MILVHAILAWGLCGALIGIGFKVTSIENTLILHAIGVPIIFGTISLIYFNRFNYTTPLQTAVLFLSFAILMDFFVVAMAVQKSFEMFASILGTWIPFALIFGSTYLMGSYITGGLTSYPTWLCPARRFRKLTGEGGRQRRGKAEGPKVKMRNPGI
jgi:hypothetical protein